MTTREYRLPDLGEGLTEADVVTWRVAPGDHVALNQIVAEVETAKALVELPSPYAGVIVRLHAEPGQTLEVGEPLVTIDVEGAGEEPAPGATPATPDPGVPEAAGVLEQTQPMASADAAPGPAESTRQPNLVGYGAAPERSGRPARRPRKDVAPAPAQPARHAETADAPDDAGDVRIPVRGVRKRTAEAMVASAFTAPHASVWLTTDVTPLRDLRERLAGHPVARGTRITVLALVARAVCIALARHPALNSSWHGDEIVQHGRVRLGIAVATERGLVVPVIDDAGRLGLVELAQALDELTTEAREGRTPPARMTGGTFTITNVGVFGVEGGTPILNPGESGILAVGAVQRRPWEHDGGIALRDVTTLSLSFDHRVVDGEQASRFLAEVAGLLADPALALALA